MVYLLDTSGLVRLLSDTILRSAWSATAAHHGLTVLHDDQGYRTVARHAPDLGEHSVHDVA
ncbi:MULTISPECIES: hypothetical protein [unclassified Streptomyces]|uniref:hypothetical protein n=1 Tax=unclassified Streptomyces TaxID=2593676 RepID=UPI003450B08D